LEQLEFMLAVEGAAALDPQEDLVAAVLAMVVAVVLEVQQLDMDLVAAVLGLVVPEELVDLDLLVSSSSATWYKKTTFQTVYCSSKAVIKIL
jgi:hypothetical protein